MLGGYFRRSIRQNAIGVLKVEDPTHPATRMLGGSWPVVDEFYHFGTAPWDASRPKENIDVLFGNHIPMGFSRDRVHVLLSLDTEKTDIPTFPTSLRGGDYPQAWWRDYGKGRTFYTSLGHRDDIWSNDPVFRAHILGGIRWALGLENSDDARLRQACRWPTGLGCSGRPRRIAGTSPAIRAVRAAGDAAHAGVPPSAPQLGEPRGGHRVLLGQFPAPRREHVRGPAGAAVAQQRLGAVHQGRSAAGDAAADGVLALRLARHRRAQEPRRVPAAAASRCCRSTPATRRARCSSAATPGRARGGVLGLTQAGIAEAKAKGVKPAGGAGFAYLRGPDDALIEYQGNMPAERFNHVHMFQDQPFCAQLWYQTRLNVPSRRAAWSAGQDRGRLPRRARPRQDVPRARIGTACIARPR